MKKLIIFSSIITMIVPLFALETHSTQELFYSYLKNDSDIRNLTIEAEKSQLSYDSTKLNNGFDITLSTGTIKLSTTGSNSSLNISGAGVTATVPQAQNLKLSTSTSMDITNGENQSSSTRLSLSADIISGNSITRKISLMKAERTLLEAKRKLENAALTAEKSFYNELKSLLNSTSSLITAESNLYKDTIDFESTKAKGYSTSSSTYRLAQMKVISDQHDIESQKRELARDYMIFYKKCGLEITLDENTDFYSLIPTDLQKVTALNIEDFDADKFSTTEKALWNHEINSLSRSAEKNFTLSANGGYTFKTAGDTVDAGLSSTIGGVNLSAGISVPVSGESKDPTYTLSATISPMTFLKNKNKQKTNDLTEEQELLEIENARSEYETTVMEKKQKLMELDWTKSTNQESYEMYQELEKEMKQYYQQGIIKESEYRSAEVNVKNYKVKLASNEIDYIIYNNELQTLFVNE